MHAHERMGARTPYGGSMDGDDGEMARVAEEECRVRCEHGLLRRLCAQLTPLGPVHAIDCRRRPPAKTAYFLLCQGFRKQHVCRRGEDRRAAHYHKWHARTEVICQYASQRRAQHESAVDLLSLQV